MALSSLSAYKIVGRIGLCVTVLYSLQWCYATREGLGGGQPEPTYDPYPHRL